MKEDLDICKHVFKKFQVPSGDSCVAIYHDICMICRWDNRKNQYVPDDIWYGWIVPQIKKMKEIGNI